MEPISNLPPIVPVKETNSLLSRAFASFGSEIDQLLNMTKEAPVQPPALGTRIDVRV
jgi:hypothetical protein